MNKHWIRLGMVALLLGSMQISQPMQAQEVAREAKLHTYVMENPYDVPEIKAPKGKKVKNVVLMIGDGTQPMKTKMPISPTRIQKVWERLGIS